MLINLTVILITLIIAAFFDLKQKTVPGWVIYPLLIIGIFLNLLLMASSTGIMAYVPLLIALVFFAAMIIIHEKNLLGGADILLITGILLAIPKEFVTPDFYMCFFLFTCVTGIFYFLILLGFSAATSSNKIIDSNIKFVPCILIGFGITVFGLFRDQIMAALVGLL